MYVWTVVSQKQVLFYLSWKQYLAIIIIKHYSKIVPVGDAKTEHMLEVVENDVVSCLLISVGKTSKHYVCYYFLGDRVSCGGQTSKSVA